MSKIVKNSTDLNKPVDLADIKKELDNKTKVSNTLVPSPPQRQAKSRFWARYDSTLLGEPETLSLADIARVVKDNRLDKWWSEAGFKEWFLNRDEAKERLDYIWNLGLDSIEAIFMNPESNDNAKVNAFKQISSLAGKEPSKNTEFTDADIQRMDKEKLKAYIERQAPKFLPPAKETSDASPDIQSSEKTDPAK
jgi:hypothetical protein